MKIAFIHNNKKISTGAHFINDLIVKKCRELGVLTKNFYPAISLIDTPNHLKGLNSILFFYSLLEKRGEILKYDLIQGTTYTPLAFLRFSKPIVSHFGSTTQGFLDSVPQTHSLQNEEGKVFYELKRDGIISELNIKTRRPLRDVAMIEKFAAQKADAVIATSELVKKELLRMSIPEEKIFVIHNAIEDYWFENESVNDAVQDNGKPHLVFLGRLGKDGFVLKLKGLDRLIYLFKKFPGPDKTIIAMSRNRKLPLWLSKNIRNVHVFFNVKKDNIPSLLQAINGNGILFIPSRYEGFSLSLIEGMSQGLVPITYPVGVAPEIIDGSNGFIVNNLKEAAEKVDLLIKNKDIRRRMSANARKTAIEKFQAQLFVGNMIRVYEKIIKNYDERRVMETIKNRIKNFSPIKKRLLHSK